MPKETTYTIAPLVWSMLGDAHTFIAKTDLMVYRVEYEPPCAVWCIQHLGKHFTTYKRAKDIAACKADAETHWQAHMKIGLKEVK